MEYVTKMIFSANTKIKFDFFLSESLEDACTMEPCSLLHMMMGCVWFSVSRHTTLES